MKHWAQEEDIDYKVEEHFKNFIFFNFILILEIKREKYIYLNLDKFSCYNPKSQPKNLTMTVTADPYRWLIFTQKSISPNFVILKRKIKFYVVFSSIHNHLVESEHCR